MCEGFDKMQVYEDVCVSIGGLAMSSNKAFQDEIGSNLGNRNQIQVTLVHEQIPNMDFQDNLSETDPEWEAQVDFKHLDSYTLMGRIETLIANQKLIPLIAKIVTMVG